MPTVPDRQAAPMPLLSLAERLSRTIAVARALISAGRRVDLAGIDDGIGMLCAKSLDLPPAEAAALLPALHDLRTQVDSLTAALHAARSS